MRPADPSTNQPAVNNGVGTMYNIGVGDDDLQVAISQYRSTKQIPDTTQHTVVSAQRQVVNGVIHNFVLATSDGMLHTVNTHSYSQASSTPLILSSNVTVASVATPSRNVGAIVGGVVGGTVGLLVIVVVITIFIVKYRRRRQQQAVSVSMNIQLLSASDETA